MRVLVFQHVDCEHPGSLRQFLSEDGIEWDPVYLHRGDSIPSFDNYDALWVMGGPMDVWDIEENPWRSPHLTHVFSLQTFWNDFFDDNVWAAVAMVLLT